MRISAGARAPRVLEQQAQRAADVQLRLADRITAFAGVDELRLHSRALFTVWMVLIESKPWPTLTLIVSLEAIFLSTFVMIGQNRQAAFQQAKADHDFTEQELELKTNATDSRDRRPHHRTAQPAAGQAAAVLMVVWPSPGDPVGTSDGPPPQLGCCYSASPAGSPSGGCARGNICDSRPCPHPIAARPGPRTAARHARRPFPQARPVRAPHLRTALRHARRPAAARPGPVARRARSRLVMAGRASSYRAIGLRY